MNQLIHTGLTKWRASGLTLNGGGPAYTGHPSPQLTDQGQYGVKVSGCKSWGLNDFEISNHLGSGIEFTSSLGFDDFVTARSGHIHDCYRGIYTKAGGEYANFSEIALTSNVFGLHCDSGNNIFTGLKAAKNSIGMYFSGGSNHAHGVVSGCTSNHNNQNLVVHDVTIGQCFTGCNFFGPLLGSTSLGSIEIARSYVTFTGGHMGSTNITIDATSRVSMRGVTFHGKINVYAPSGAMLDAKDSVIIPGAVLTLNDAPWNGNT
jgi:hypothetical protein